MTVAEAHAESSAAQVLRYPAGTTLRFVLLIVMVALSAVFVGDSLFLGTNPTYLLPSWQWLAIPPVAVLAAAAILTALAPAWLEHRHRWVSVPPDRGGAALARYDRLVTGLGLSARPPLVWSASGTSSSALAYGRPGAYRIAIGPALLGAARRRPATFDAVLRHELAHIRHRDVAIAYYAIAVWYVLIGALAIPVLWWAVDRDWSLLPEYGLRMSVLALLVYWVRAAVLRAREHYADVRSAEGPQDQEALKAALTSSTRMSALERTFSLHPTAASRIATLADPRALARLEIGEMFAVGLTATWTLPLLHQLLVSVGFSPVDAPRAARMVMFALVGAYVGAVVARWAGCAAPIRDSARAAGGLAVGLSLGSVLSVGSAGLLSFAGDEFAAMVVAAIIAGAYLLWAADFARVLLEPERRQRVRLATALSIGVTAGVFALLAGGVFPVIELLRLLGWSSAVDLLRADPFDVLGISPYPTALAIITALSGAVAVVAGNSRGRRALSTCATGLSLGVFAALLTVAVRLQVDLHNNDDRTWRYYLAAVWITVGAAVIGAMIEAAGRGLGRLATAFLTAGLATVTSGCLFAAFEDIAHGSSLGIAEVGLFARHAASVAILLAPVLAALGWLAQNLVAHRPARPASIRVAAAAVVLGVAAVVVIALVPGLVSGPPPKNELPGFFGQHMFSRL